MNVPAFDFLCWLGRCFLSELLVLQGFLQDPEMPLLFAFPAAKGEVGIHQICWTCNFGCLIYVPVKITLNVI